MKISISLFFQISIDRSIRYVSKFSLFSLQFYPFQIIFILIFIILENIVNEILLRSRIIIGRGVFYDKSHFYEIIHLGSFCKVLCFLLFFSIFFNKFIIPM